jgi:hypothetical protein
MARKPPNLCGPRRDGRYYVTDPGNGREVYFGTNRRKAEQAYHRWLSEFLGRAAAIGGMNPPPSYCSVAELLLAHDRWAEQYSRKNGKATSELRTIRQVSVVVLDLYGPTPAADFGAAAV